MKQQNKKRKGYWLGKKRKPSHGIFLKGHKVSEETKEKLRSYKGENHWNWQGGISEGESKKNYLRNWWRTNRDKAVVYTNRRRALKENNGGTYTLEEWCEKQKEYDYKCAICGIEELELLEKTGRELTVDHIVPLSRGGLNSIENIQPACGSCNSKKSNIF